MFSITAFAAHIRTAGLSARGLAYLRELGPYVAIELLLPGGSLIALLLWLYSRHKSGKPFFPLRLRVSTSRTAPLTVLSESRSPLHLFKLSP